MTCLECGERRRQWGAYCGPCFRLVNGGAVRVVEPPPAPEPPPPPPKPPKVAKVAKVAKPRKVAATKLPPPPKVTRRCEWPGCTLVHSMHGACRRHAVRLAAMKAQGTDPATWPARWEARQLEVAAKMDTARRSMKGKKQKRHRQRPEVEALRAALRERLTDAPTSLRQLVAELGATDHAITRALRAIGARRVGSTHRAGWARP